VTCAEIALAVFWERKKYQNWTTEMLRDSWWLKESDNALEVIGERRTRPATPPHQFKRPLAGSITLSVHKKLSVCIEDSCAYKPIESCAIHISLYYHTIVLWHTTFLCTPDWSLCQPL
jgi:hypothetical protein